MSNYFLFRYLGCDPTAYLLNMYWDKEMRKKCAQCGNTYSRPVFKNHVSVCQAKSATAQGDDKLNEDGEAMDESTTRPTLTSQQHEEENEIESMNSKQEPKENKRLKNTVSRVLNEMLDQIESEFEDDDTQGECASVLV